MSIFRTASLACIVGAFCLTSAAIAQAPTPSAKKSTAAQSQPAQAWMDSSLDPDTRADLMIHEMTLDEKIQLVHGDGWGVLRKDARVAPGHNGGAGFVPGIPRLHLPEIGRAHV